MDVAKEFCQKAFSRETITKLSGLVVAGAELTDDAVRAVVRRIGDLIRFGLSGRPDGELWQLFSKLVTYYPEVASQAMYDVLTKMAVSFRSISGSLSQAKGALTPLRWTFLLLSRVEVNIGHLNLLSIFLAAIPANSSVQSLCSSVRAELTRRLLTPEVALKWLGLLVKAKTFHLYCLVLVAVLIAYFRGKESSVEFPGVLYLEVVKWFVGSVLGSRLCPEPLIILSCTDIFKNVTHAMFKDVLLPAIRKALLRNPDELMATVVMVLSSVLIDLSEYGVEVFKCIVPHLSSSHPETSAAAHDCLSALCRQCSDKEVATSLGKQLDGALKSSPASKLTVADHRCSVLKGMRCLVEAPLSSSGKAEVAGEVAKILAVHIKQEVHLGTSVVAVNVLVAFCELLEDCRLTIDFIKESLASKTTPPPVRACLLRCVRALCREEDNAALLSISRTSLSRLSTLASMQATGLEEAVVACDVIIKLHSPDPAPQEVWSFANSHGEQVFSHKVLSSVSKESLPVMVGVARALLCAEDCSLSESSRKEWLGGVVKILLESPWQTRREAVQCIQRVVESKPVLAEELLDILQDLVDKTAEFPAHLVLLALKSLTLPTHPKKQVLAVRNFLISHYPLIVATDTSAWLGLLQKGELDPSSLIRNSQNELASLLQSNMSTRHGACVRGLKTLVLCGGIGVVSVLVGGVCEVLGASGVVRASEEDMEILCTSEGQLWHGGLKKELNAAIHGGAEPVANMKKESKIYSYEDQKWEAELRQELLRKKRAESEGTENDTRSLLKKAKLSQKMKDTIESQLVFEEEKRRRLLDLRQRLSEGVELLEVVADCGDVGRDLLLSQIPRLSNAVREAVKSPLACGYCRRIWGVVATVVFRDWKLAELFAETTFCTLKVQVLSPVLPAVIALLKNHSLCTYDLNCGCQSLTLPFLRQLLTSRDSKAVAHDLKTSGMHVLRATVERHLKALDQEGAVVSFDPSLFPGVQTLDLLSSVIALEDQSPKFAILKRSSVSMYVSLLPHVLQDGLAQVTEGVFHSSSLLRHTVFTGLSSLPKSELPTDPQLLAGLYIARHEEDEANCSLATSLWETHHCEDALPVDFPGLLTGHCCSPNLSIHDQAAKSLGAWLQHHPTQISKILNHLISAYHTHRTKPPPTKDSFGREILIEFRDEWECRVGVAKALEQLSTHASSDEVLTFLNFVIPGALSDPNTHVHAALMLAAQAAIGCHGEELADQLMRYAGKSLEEIENKVETDAVRQSIILLMGTLARHMDRNNKKVKEVVHLLLSNLDTPSQKVQEAIANCLPPLAPVVKDDVNTIVPRLVEKLLDSTSYSQRKGSAYGLAGLVKGLGIPVLKSLEVISKLLEALKDKKNFRHREGALLAIQSLSAILGKVFEPYIIKLLPDLLVCFGDGNQYVRDAMDQTARTIMAQLSTHGVKMVLPSLLKTLEEEESWRTKAGSVELLGAMAYCAPKQLSSCLPSIVPKLMDTLADSHSKVQVAGTQALKQIGSVIKNPQIQSLVPMLLEALSDPSNKANECLQELLNTEFIHVIDPPSLALIMPTLKRTLDLRSTDTKKMAAQIIGNMYVLTDKKDLTPYLAEVLPGLQKSLVDPVPEVRTVCAKALGAIVRGMGEEGMKDLLPWLLDTLKSDGTSVDRSGAAQGISEVLYARGVEELSKVMPHFLASSQDTTLPTHVRDGYLMLFVYLPLTFGEQLAEFIGDILTPVLKGLSDESEFVRETSLLAGQTIVNRYSDKAVELFLPQLERGLFDDNWRIRCSSVQLLGDLLYKISGLSGKMSTESEEDDNFGTEAAHQVLLKSLGRECRDRVFAGLYMGRGAPNPLCPNVFDLLEERRKTSPRCLIDTHPG